jgi:hypothetical protein
MIVVINPTYLILNEKSTYAHLNNFENIYVCKIILNFIPLLKYMTVRLLENRPRLNSSLRAL